MSITPTELSKAFKDANLGWSTERTLLEIEKKISGTNAILNAIADKQQVDTKKIKEFADGVSDATNALNDYRKEELKAAEDAISRRRIDDRIEQNKREQNYKYKQSIDDLRSSMSKLRPDRWGGVVEEKMLNISGYLTEAGFAGKALGKSLQALTIGVSYVAGLYLGGRKTFQDLIASGVDFNGSLAQMEVSAFKTGMSVEEFGNIVKQHSMVISGIGGKSFSDLTRGVQDATKKFGYYGMTQDQVAETVANNLDMLNSYGGAYGQTVEQLIESSTKYAAELTGLQKLTGQDRKALQEKQKAAMADTAIRMRMRQLKISDPAAAAKLEKNITTMAAANVPKEMIRSMVGMQFGIAPSDAATRQLIPFSYNEQLQQMSQGLMGADTGQIAEMSKDLITRLMSDQRLMDVVTPLQFTKKQSFREVAEMIAGGDQNLFSVGERMNQPTAGGWFDFFTGKKGNMDETTTNLMKGFGDMAHITGDFNAKLIDATESLKLFSKATAAFSGLTGMGTGISGWGSGLSSATSLLLPLGAMAGFSMLKGKAVGKMFSGVKGGIKGLAGVFSSSGFGGIEKILEKDTFKNLFKFGEKTVGKSLLEKIPILGLIAGGGFAIDRAIRGDWLGAGGELLSGALSTVPGLGTGASVAVDAALAARDSGVFGNNEEQSGDMNFTGGSSSASIATAPNDLIITMTRLNNKLADNQGYIASIVNMQRKVTEYASRTAQVDTSSGNSGQNAQIHAYLSDLVDLTRQQNEIVYNGNRDIAKAVETYAAYG